MIRVLEKNVADKIAAGEVIERPVSIVKELVENSVDSGADSIVVEIKNGGKAYIRVTDNGCGIPSDEAETAFLRHATSKIERAGDLDAIETLGFRGEALASIAAVTHTEFITKTREEKTGTRILIHGSEVLENKKTGCPDGTTIIVTDLFYNTPARRKFLKTDSAESGQIIDLMSQIALAYPSVRFRLISNGNILFSTTGKGDLQSTILSVYKLSEYKDLIPLSYEENGICITGCISRPSLTRTNRKHQIFFVNGRVVHSKIIEKGVAEGYKERLFEGRQPVAFLFISTDPGSLDVNIHPNKREVRFDNEKEITELTAKAIRNTLGTKAAVTEVRNIFTKSETSESRISDTISESGTTSENGTTASQTGSDSMETIGSQEQVDIKQILSTKRELDRLNGENRRNESLRQEEVYAPLKTKEEKAAYLTSSSYQEEKTEKSRVQADPSYASSAETEIRENRKIRTEDPENGSEKQTEDKTFPAKPLIEIERPAMQPFDFTDLTLTGVIFNTYITAVDGKNFFLIDQHAAHERVFYEKLVGEYLAGEKLRQPILTPIILEVPLSVKENEYDWLDSLTDIGFLIEEFGQNSYVIREIPTFMSLSEAEDFAKEFIDGITEGTKLLNTVVINKLIIKSCKSAVKAHDRLSMEEMRALIDQLSACRNPFSCPHGRPTFIRMSQYEIEKMFKRV